MEYRELERQKSYCFEIEKIENYELAKLDNFKNWHCHHRLETHDSDGNERAVYLMKKELIALDIYYNRPANELIFLKASDHLKLHQSGKHNCFYGKRLTDKHKRKAVETRMKNGSYKMSEEQKRKMGEVRKGKKHSEETKAKISASLKGLSSPRKGKHWKLVDGHRVWY